MRGNGRARRLAAERLEGRDHVPLQHVEHLLALDERHLEVELAELELAVGAEILVAPAGGDLVVAVDPADHAELLEDLRRLGEREEAPRLQAHGEEEVARAFGCALRHAGRPDVDEAEVVHRPPDGRDHRVREPQVALHLARAACRGSASAGACSRPRAPRRAGRAAAASATGSRAGRPGAPPRPSAGWGSPPRGPGARPRPRPGGRTRCAPRAPSRPPRARARG